MSLLGDVRVPRGNIVTRIPTRHSDRHPSLRSKSSVRRYYFFKKMRVSLDKRVSMGSGGSPRAKRQSSDSVGAKRSRSASLDKTGLRQEARAPVLIAPRPPSIDEGAGALASRSDHRRHVLDAVRSLMLPACRSHVL